MHDSGESALGYYFYPLFDQSWSHCGLLSFKFSVKNPWQEKTMPEDGDRLTNRLRSILCVNGRNGVFPPQKIYDEGEGCDEVFPGVLIGDM